MSRSEAPTQLVIDASALVELLLQSKKAKKIEQAIGDAELIAPDLVNLEVMQVLRKFELRGKLTRERASTAVSRLVESQISRFSTLALLEDAWSMHDNLTAYDACYVALAREHRCELLTTDIALSKAPRLNVAVTVV
jgi:predicted nucleic acid-binding protein